MKRRFYECAIVAALHWITKSLSKIGLDRRLHWFANRDLCWDFPRGLPTRVHTAQAYSCLVGFQSQPTRTCARDTWAERVGRFYLSYTYSWDLQQTVGSAMLFSSHGLVLLSLSNLANGSAMLGVRDSERKQQRCCKLALVISKDVFAHFFYASWKSTMCWLSRVPMLQLSSPTSSHAQSVAPHLPIFSSREL